MNYFYIDPSALAKRYHTEEGSDVVDELLDSLFPDKGKRIFISIWGIAETLSVLNRKKNERNIRDEDFRKILSSFLSEASKFSIESVTDSLIISSFGFILKHDINSADALHIASVTGIKDIAKSFKNDIILVASDKRLIRAAKSEKMGVIDPEVESREKIKELLK